MTKTKGGKNMTKRRNPFLSRAGFNRAKLVVFHYKSGNSRNPFLSRAGFNWWEEYVYKKEGKVMSQSLFK